MKTSQILALSAVLAAVGLLLLCGGPDGVPRGRSSATTLAAATTSASAPQHTGPPTASASPVPTTATSVPATAVARTAVLPGKALAPDDGPGGDHLIQAMLDAHTPHNLPTEVERRLDQLGRAVWLADVTGQGRAQWPRYFSTSGSSGYSGVPPDPPAAEPRRPDRTRRLTARYPRSRRSGR